MIFIKKRLIGILFVIDLLGISACSMTENKPQTVQTNETIQEISEKKAEEIALSTLKGGIVKNNHVDKDGQSNEFEVVIVKDDKQFEVDVDAETGKALEINQNVEGEKKIDDDERELEQLSPKISLAEAKQIALDRVRGTITEINLETENNRLVYDIEISTVYRREAKVTVDAIDGNVLKVEEETK